MSSTTYNFTSATPCNYNYHVTQLC